MKIRRDNGLISWLQIIEATRVQHGNQLLSLIRRKRGKHGEIDVYSYGSDKAEDGTGEARDVGNW